MSTAKKSTPSKKSSARKDKLGAPRVVSQEAYAKIPAVYGLHFVGEPDNGDAKVRSPVLL